MKLVVNTLPYYGEECICAETGFCAHRNDKDVCPRFWDKHFINSESNPHECRCLTELEKELWEYF